MKLTSSQFQALLEYLDARIAEKIEDARPDRNDDWGSLLESKRRSEAEEALRKELCE